MKKKKDTEKQKIDKTVLELLPFAVYDTKAQGYKLKDGSYMDLFKIRTKDLINCSHDSFKYDVYRLEKFYKTIGEDIKLVALNFPCETTNQIKYFEHLIRNCKNDVYLKFLERKRDELVWIGKNTTSREYVYFIFAKNYEELEKLRKSVLAALGTGPDGLMELLSADMKHKICRKINNKNMVMG